MKITFFGHATFLVETMGKKLLFDPFFTGNPANDDINVDDIEADFIFMGHTHRPFIRESATGKVFVNVGSCGMPRDRGDWGSATLFDEKSGDIRIIRFSIKEETDEMLKEITDLHPSILNFFNRNDEKSFGEFIDV